MHNQILLNYVLEYCESSLKHNHNIIKTANNLEHYHKDSNKNCKSSVYKTILEKRSKSNHGTIAIMAVYLKYCISNSNRIQKVYLYCFFASRY